jgi:sulfur-oxidizing protein SoxX
MRRLMIAAALCAHAAAAGDRNPVAYTVINAAEIPTPLSAAPADAARGAAIAADPARGGCLACHGDAARTPPLRRIAPRLSEAALRLAVVNAAIRNPALADHAFYDVAQPAADGEAPPETRLTAGEVEDIVAWLSAMGD